MSAVQVAVADDDVLLREGLASLLDLSGFYVAGQVAGAAELLALVRDHTPGLVVVDIRMPPTHTTEGLDAARAIKPQSDVRPQMIGGCPGHETLRGRRSEQIAAIRWRREALQCSRYRETSADLFAYDRCGRPSTYGRCGALFNISAAPPTAVVDVVPTRVALTGLTRVSHALPGAAVVRSLASVDHVATARHITNAAALFASIHAEYADQLACVRHGWRSWPTSLYECAIYCGFGAIARMPRHSFCGLSDVAALGTMTGGGRVR